VIERRHRQRSLFEATIGSMEKLVEGLIEPELVRLDEILADEALLESVVERLARRRPQSRLRGRPGTPAEVVLRMLVLKRLKAWTFDETEREVRRSLVYRQLVRVYFERVPDAKTLIRLSAVLGSEAVEVLNVRLVEMAREEGVIRGRRARVDTTVVETNVHYPTDSSLLVDGVRVMTRGMKRIEAGTRSTTKGVRNRMRAANRRLMEIGLAARNLMRKAARDRLQRGYRRLLALAGGTMRDAARIVSELVVGSRALVSEKAQGAVERARRKLETTLPLVGRVIAQARARIFGGDTHYPDKLLSLFEPHTEAIRKGKASKPTEFGKFVRIQEAENQVVVDYEVYHRRIDDQALLLPAISAHEAIFGKPPRLIAADRGFWSAKNKREAKAAGVAKVCIPAQAVSPRSSVPSRSSAGFGAANACALAAKDASASSSAATA
jgi:IS5 family transposase